MLIRKCQDQQTTWTKLLSCIFHELSRFVFGIKHVMKTKLTRNDIKTHFSGDMFIKLLGWDSGITFDKSSWKRLSHAFFPPIMCLFDHS